MSMVRSPLDAAAFRTVCAYAVANVILPDDVIRVAAGLRPREPFIIDPSRVRGGPHYGERFRSVLAELYRGNASKFEAAAPMIRGTKRTYFGLTREEIESTGNSNNAGKIPGSPWWVSINNSQPTRVEIVQSVMTHMGFSFDYARMVSRLSSRSVAELPSHYVRALSKLPSL